MPEQAQGVNETNETRSAPPIKDNVGMAMALIPHAGMAPIQVGNRQVPVSTDA
jgi:hypothetical protein